MDNRFENGSGLPSEIMFHIMLLIDAADVFEMRVVSKNWCDSIKDKKFIMQHSKLAKSRCTQHLVTCKVPKDKLLYNTFYTMSDDYSEEEEWVPMTPHPYVPHMHMFDFVGAIDGILCLEHNYQHSTRQYVICNLVTGQNCTIHAPAPIDNSCKYLF